MDRDALSRLGRAALPILAVTVFLGMSWLTVTSATSSTLGYDFQAYLHAAQRAIDGRPLYDATVEVAGGFAIFLYPPPFVLVVMPFVVADPTSATYLWILAMGACFIFGSWLMPVQPTIRWLVILLGGLSWPLLYAIKLGQVGPLLYLLFAIGWRYLDRPIVLGASIATGALIKVQPILLIGWAGLTGRWRAVAVGIAIVSGSVVLTSVMFGASTWTDYLALLRRVTDPISTPHSVTVGAIAYRGGLGVEAANALQGMTMVAVLATGLLAIRFAPDDVSYITMVVATQLLSPVLWDHYALILLLPTAWLLQQRQWWACAIPLVTSVTLVGDFPEVVYPLAFGIALIGPLTVHVLTRHRRVLTDRSAVVR